MVWPCQEMKKKFPRSAIKWVAPQQKGRYNYKQSWKKGLKML